MLTNSQIQIALNKAKAGPIAVDGIIGPQSREAVKRFQRANHLMPDGIVGAKTNAALEKVYASISSTPSKPPVAIKGDKKGMELSPRGLQMLDHSEDIRTKAYWDSKHVLTIGLGMTMGSEIFREWWKENRPDEDFTINSRMTMNEIMPLVHRMLNEEYAKAANEALAYRKVPQHQFDAAVHALWNMGKHATDWRWFKALKAGNIKESAHLLRTAYNKPPELFSRRQKEGDLMEHGVYA